MRNRIRMATPHSRILCLSAGQSMSTSMIMGAKFVLFEVLLVLSCYQHVEPSVFTEQFSQNTVELLPCKKQAATVSLYNNTLLTIMANLTLCSEMDIRHSNTIVSKVFNSDNIKQCSVTLDHMFRLE